VTLLPLFSLNKSTKALISLFPPKEALAHVVTYASVATSYLYQAADSYTILDISETSLLNFCIVEET
jgi:hypothetical protein